MKDIRVTKQPKKSGGQTVKMFDNSITALDIYRKWRNEDNYLVTYEIHENGKWNLKLEYKQEYL